MDSVWREIEELRDASTAQLYARYRELFDEEPPSKHRQALFRRLAWRLQANRLGGLSQEARQKALEIANNADLRVLPPRGFSPGKVEQAGKTVRRRWRFDRRIPPAGTILRREYRGRCIVATILVDGFEYENRQYSSLSAIALEATGTRWNGLAFFGLTQAHARRRRGRRG